MYIEFVKSSGDYDFVSPAMNMIGNGLVYGGGGFGSALIVALALKSLGYSKAAIIIGSTFPIIAGTVGLATAAIGAIFIAVMVANFSYR